MALYRANLRRSAKCLEFILRGTWMDVLSCMVIHTFHDSCWKTEKLRYVTYNKWNAVLCFPSCAAAVERRPWALSSKPLANSGRTASGDEPQPPSGTTFAARKTQRGGEKNQKEAKRERRSAKRREGSGWEQSMDAVRIEGTARSSLTRKRKISKLSRRIETRRQVSSHFVTLC